MAGLFPQPQGPGSLLAAPASAPLRTGEGSTQGSRPGPGNAVDLAPGPAGSCLGKHAAEPGRSARGHTQCVQECV